MAMRYHTVRRGETLAGIAQAYYGDSTKGSFIYAHNKHYITNRNHLNAGQKILIPHLPVLPRVLGAVFP